MSSKCNLINLRVILWLKVYRFQIDFPAKWTKYEEGDMALWFINTDYRHGEKLYRLVHRDERRTLGTEHGAKMLALGPLCLLRRGISKAIAPTSHWIATGGWQRTTAGRCSILMFEKLVVNMYSHSGWKIEGQDFNMSRHLFLRPRAIYEKVQYWTRHHVFDAVI